MKFQLFALLAMTLTPIAASAQTVAPAIVPIISSKPPSLSAADTIHVFIFGAVRQPGLLRLKPDATPLDAIAEAGGFSILPDDATMITLVMGAKASRRLTVQMNAQRLMKPGNKGIPRLEDGDALLVNRELVDTRAGQPIVTSPLSSPQSNLPPGSRPQWFNGRRYFLIPLLLDTPQ